MSKSVKLAIAAGLSLLTLQAGHAYAFGLAGAARGISGENLVHGTIITGSVITPKVSMKREALVVFPSANTVVDFETAGEWSYTTTMCSKIL